VCEIYMHTYYIYGGGRRASNSGCLHETAGKMHDLERGRTALTREDPSCLLSAPDPVMDSKPDHRGRLKSQSRLDGWTEITEL